MSEFTNILKANRSGEARGIYSVCSAHPLVIEAAIEQAKADNSPILIEATANQVNQYGGYTGMLPADFFEFIGKIADSKNYPRERVILGGDHLGPVCWVDEPSKVAMEKARVLIKSYVAAGFQKIHLDTSMNCADDPQILPDEVVAERAADLCSVAEKTAIHEFGRSDLYFVIGTEVPPPGGAKEEILTLELTPVSRVKQTLELHKNSFVQRGLSSAWNRVVGLVVQPGVEFDHTSLIDYQSEKAQALKAFITKVPTIVYEAHSSDYQNDDAYIALVQDHFGILKVGPQLTFALREALFALTYMEDELFPLEQRSNLRDICESVMIKNPSNWQKFYQVPTSKETLYRRYSYSDRIRYYWNHPEIENAVSLLFNNLTKNTIPLPLLSQFLPEQYRFIRKGVLENTPKELVKAKIKQVTESYAQACWKQ